MIKKDNIKILYYSLNTQKVQFVVYIYKRENKTQAVTNTEKYIRKFLS